MKTRKNSQHQCLPKAAWFFGFPSVFYFSALTDPHCRSVIKNVHKPPE
ncbi:hypothetical protein SNE25_09485 [Mucilaginibacter sabulilitoris]|uniref:Uncharacterized protein n=1 Tax=Mucilaginibacter sabulilitoris TaxID=1173583 RepID=A0ABZ0TVC4_9SPHI|nr:hypothetical protein [Mucilaginibacter sabulilitoris]WPU95749.1 hypothetical protein SNE25_09485 [Mucilaginibacter sabulilitoris]